jgi:CHAT domain-containing protein/Flp pilus assembly protein TadD
MEYRQRNLFIFLAIVIVCVFHYPLPAEESKIVPLAAHITYVSPDGKYALINRGLNDNLIPDSICIVYPNRSEDPADVFWDLPITIGKLTNIRNNTSRIEYTNHYDSVKVGDYCQLYGNIPEELYESKMGKIALNDISFVDYEYGIKFFSLKSLLKNHTQEKLNKIIDRLLSEVHTYADSIDVWYEREKISGGRFDGMTWGEALKNSKPEDIEEYLAYVCFFPEYFFNRERYFVLTYSRWTSGYTEKVEIEKKRDEAFGYTIIGDSLALENKLEESLREYEKATKLFQDYTYALDQSERVRDILLYRQILTEDPEDPYLHFELGLRYYNLRMNEDALTHFQSAKRFGYDNTLFADKYIAYTYGYMEMYDESISLLEKFLESFPDDSQLKARLEYIKAQKQQVTKGDVTSFLIAGDYKYKQKNFNQAIAEYKKAFEKQPDSQEVWNHLKKAVRRREAEKYRSWAQYYLQNNKEDSASIYWEEALNILREINDSTGIKDILYEKANYYIDSGLYEIARTTYLQIINFDPNEYDACIEISLTYKYQEDYENAIKWATTGISINPDDAWGYNILGLIYMKLSNVEKQIYHFSKAVELHTSYKWPNYNLALAYVKKEDYAKAKVFLKKAIEIDNYFWDARNDLVNIECILETTINLKKDPNDWESRVRLGRAHWHIGEYERCIDEMMKVIAKRPDDVTALSYIGYAYTELGNYAEGKLYLEKAYAVRPIPGLKAWLLYNEGTQIIAKEPNNPKGYLSLGESNLFWEYFNDAITYYQEALNNGADTIFVQDKIALVNSCSQAWDQLEASKRYLSEGDYDNSFKTALKSLNSFNSIGTKYGEISALKQIARHYSSLNKTDSVLFYCDKAINISEDRFNEYRKASILTLLGDHYSKIGEFSKALEYFRKAKTLFHKDNDLENVAWSLWYIAYLESMLGEFDKSMEEYSEALRMYEDMKMYRAQSSILDNIGWTYRNNGDYSTALKYFLKSLDIARETDNESGKMEILRSIHNFYINIGDTSNAFQYCQKYLNSTRKLKNDSLRAEAINSFGLIHLFITKDYDKALEYFIRSRNIARIANDKLMEGVAICNIGVIKYKKGELQEALKLHEESLILVRNARNPYCEMQGLEELGLTYRDLGELDKAINAHLESVEIADSLGHEMFRWQYELSTGKAYELNKDATNAIKYYKKAATTLSEIKKKIIIQDLGDFSPFKNVKEKEVEVYTRLIDLLMKTGNIEEAIVYIEESKSMLLKESFGDIKPKTDDEELNELILTLSRLQKKRDALKEQLEKEKKGIADEEMTSLSKTHKKEDKESAIKLKPATEKEEKVSEKPTEKKKEEEISGEKIPVSKELNKTKIENLTKILAETEGDFYACMLQLEESNEDLYSALSVDPTTFGDIQSDIPENILLVQYFMIPDKLCIFCVGKDYYTAKSVDIDKKQLSRTIDFFIGIIKDEHSEIEEVLEPAEELYGYLIEPIEQEIERYENIIILPHDVLYYVPFHALVHESDGKKRYLIETKKISYSISATFKDVLEESEKEREKLFAMGNPDSSLSGASTEIKILKEKIFKDNALVYTLHDATKENFFKYAKEYDIVHLATHGVLKTSRLESYLLLSGEDERSRTLTLDDIVRYTALRNRTDLVFLSACETAISRGDQKGKELTTLAKSFAIAGPPTLIATLWEADDESTTLLVTNFYNELKLKKNNKLNSLREAQISLIKTEEFSHPYFWAPFLLIGDWR